MPRHNLFLLGPCHATYCKWHRLSSCSALCPPWPVPHAVAPGRVTASVASGWAEAPSTNLLCPRMPLPQFIPPGQVMVLSSQSPANLLACCGRPRFPWAPALPTASCSTSALPGSPGSREAPGGDGSEVGRRSLTLIACLLPHRGPLSPAPAADSSAPGQLHPPDGAGLLRWQRRRLRTHHRPPLLPASRFASVSSPLVLGKGLSAHWLSTPSGS